MAGRADLEGPEIRQLTFVEAGRVEWRDAPDPEPPEPAGAVVRPLAVARCDIDRPMAATGLFPGPFPVGHDTVAEVVAVDDAVTERTVGERVVVPFQVSCGNCVACREGRFGGCRTYQAPLGAMFGFGQQGGAHGGALADLLAVPAADHLLVPSPRELPTTLLCTLPDNVVDGYRAVGPPLARHPGAEVLIAGGAAESISLYAAAAAIALGSQRVRYIDADPQRCAAAESLGADVEHRNGPWPRHFQRALITVDATGDEAGLAATLRSTDDYGTCTSVAIYFGGTTPVPLLEMYTRGVTFHVSRADSRLYLPAVLDLVAAGKLDPLAVPTTIVPWDQAAEAWLEPATKLVVQRG
jgi:threonine dehydrogenase-like Zn-dependent dehydrogenase